MARYRVTLREKVTYIFEVEADNEEDAMEAAEEAFVQGEDPYSEAVDDRRPVEAIPVVASQGG